MYEENIYNLIPKEFEQQKKQSRHVSKFKDSQSGPVGSKRSECGTMGPAKVQTRGPTDFMKKNDREARKPPKPQNDFKYPDEGSRRPPVPRHDENPLHGIRTTKNFITQNAVEAILSVPGKPERKYVDTKKGDSHNLIPSGLEPTYVQKKDFGKTPAYLESRKAEIKRAQEDYDRYVKEHCRQGAMEMLSEDTRLQILNGLKTNWEDIYHEYQGLSVVTDTAPKKIRKERMEAQMKQLERDIETMEKHRLIYIAN